MDGTVSKVCSTKIDPPLLRVLVLQGLEVQIWRNLFQLLCHRKLMQLALRQREQAELLSGPNKTNIEIMQIIANPWSWHQHAPTMAYNDIQWPISQTSTFPWKAAYTKMSMTSKNIPLLLISSDLFKMRLVSSESTSGSRCFRSCKTGGALQSLRLPGQDVYTNWTWHHTISIYEMPHPLDSTCSSLETHHVNISAFCSITWWANRLEFQVLDLPLPQEAPRRRSPHSDHLNMLVASKCSINLYHPVRSCMIQLVILFYAILIGFNELKSALA